jgi:hypothetical protein
LNENFLTLRLGKKIIKSAMQKVNAQKGIALTLLIPTVALASKSRVVFTIVVATSLVVAMSAIVENIISHIRVGGRSSS